MTEDYTALVERAARAICDSDGVDADGEIYDAENGLIIDPAWRYYESAGRAVADVVSDAIASLERQLAEVRGERDRLRHDLVEADRQAAKVEALLDPHVSWEGKPPVAQTTAEAERDRLAARCEGLERALRLARKRITSGYVSASDTGLFETIDAALQEPQT